MVQSDALSQRPNLIPDKDHDNENMMLLPDNPFLNLLDITLQECVLKLGQVDNFLKEFSPSDPPFGSPSDWRLELVNGSNTLFYKDKNYAPNNLDLWQDIVRMLHNHKMAGHSGKAQILVAVEQHYWWPGLRTFV